MKKEILVVNSKGLHGRPATVFADIAKHHPEEVSVTYGKKTVNGKSLIALMSLAVPKDSRVIVAIQDPGAKAVIDELETAMKIDYDGQQNGE